MLNLSIKNPEWNHKIQVISEHRSSLKRRPKQREDLDRTENLDIAKLRTMNLDELKEMALI